MKGLSGLTIRYMTKNWKRTVTTLVGVFFAALLIFLMFEGTESVTTSFQESDLRKAGGAEIVLQGSGEAAVGAKEEAKSGEINGVGVEKAWLMLVRGGVYIYAGFEDQPSVVEPTAGKLPSRDGEILLNENMVSGQKIGDPYQSGDHVYIVSGFYRGAEEDYTEGIAFLSEEGFRKEEDAGLCLVMKDKSGLEKQLEELSAGTMGGYVTEEALTVYKQGSDQYKQIGRDVLLLLLALVFAAFLMVIIRNAFNISVDERMKDYGILRCIGMTKSQILKMIVLEAFLVALIGTAAGILVGYGITAGGLRAASMLQVVEDTLGKGFVMHEVFSLKAILATFGIVFLTTSLSMVSPIQKLFKMSPIAAERKEEAFRRPKGSKTLLDKAGKNIAVAYGMRSAKRSRGRFARSVITYALGLALVIGFGNIVKTMLATEYPAKYSYDYSGSVLNEKKWSQLLTELSDSDVCKGAVGIVNYTEYGRQDTGWLSRDFAVSGVTENLWESITEDTALSPEEGKDYIEVVSAISTVGEKPRYDVGDTFQVKGSDKTFHVAGTVNQASLTLVTGSNGIRLDACTYGNYVYLEDPERIVFDDQDHVGIAAGEPYEINGVVSAEASGSKKELQNIMNDKLSRTEAVGAAFAVLGAIRTGTIAVLAFLLLIAVVNAINVCRGQLNVRRDEIKTLRLIGMSERQRQRMILSENMSASVVAAVVGPVIGIAAAFLVTKVIYQGNGLTGDFDSFEMSMHYAVDWGILIISVAAVLLSGFLVTFFNRKD